MLSVGTQLVTRRNERKEKKTRGRYCERDKKERARKKEAAKSIYHHFPIAKTHTLSLSPQINAILRRPIIRDRIAGILSETVMQDEFTATFLDAVGMRPSPPPIDDKENRAAPAPGAPCPAVPAEAEAAKRKAAEEREKEERLRLLKERAKAKKLAEEEAKARQAAEARARLEAEAKARLEAEARARAKARLEVERKMRQKAEDERKVKERADAARREFFERQRIAEENRRKAEEQLRPPAAPPVDVEGKEKGKEKVAEAARQAREERKKEGVQAQMDRLKLMKEEW